MAPDDLDTVDKGILYLLQENARSHTTEQIGEKVGVSSSTVGNRIAKLEERGVITGYHPTIDYEKTGLGHHVLVFATVPFEERGLIGDEIMAVTGVVGLRELLSNKDNVTIELVGRNKQDIEQALVELNAIGVEVTGMEMIKRERTNPYNHFGKEFTTE